MRLIRVVVAACALAALALVAPTAAAAPSTSAGTAVTVRLPSGTGTATIHLGSTAHPAATQQPATACTITAGIYTGTYVCESQRFEYFWGGVREELFVLGTNGVVYHIWQRGQGDSQWSGWYPLGGSNNVVGGIYPFDPQPSTGPGMAVRGSDGQLWCDVYGTSGWTNWYACGR